MALPCLVPVISPYADLGCPAFHLPAMAAVEASAPASASVWRPTRFPFSCTHALTPLYGRSLPSCARCSLILCQRGGREKLPPVAQPTPARAVAQLVLPCSGLADGIYCALPY